MSSQERKIEIDRAHPLLKAFAGDSWIAETHDVRSMHKGNRQELSGQIWTPDLTNEQDGVWRPMEITLSHYDKGGGYLSIELPLTTGECPPEFTDFPDELNAGLRRYFREAVTSQNPELTYEIIPGIAHEEDDGLAVIFEPYMDGVEDQGATWCFTLDFDGKFSPQQFGYRTMEEFAGAVTYRLAAAVSPAVNYLQQKFPDAYQKLVSKREQRTRTKPPSWIFGFFKKCLQEAGGEWRQPQSGTEPDTYFAYGSLPIGNNRHISILAHSTETVDESGKFRQNWLSVAALSDYVVTQIEKPDAESLELLQQMVAELEEYLRATGKNGTDPLKLYSHSYHGETRPVDINFLTLPKINETQWALFGLRLTLYGIDIEGLARKGVTPDQIIGTFLDRVIKLNSRVTPYVDTALKQLKGK